MILKFSFIFAICRILEIAGHFLRENNYKKYHLVENKQDLENYVKFLKDQNEYNTESVDDEEKEKKLQTILWLIKKNFNAQKMYEDMHKNMLHSGARLYLIKNTAVLDGSGRHLERKRFPNDDARNDRIERENLKTKLRNIRRRVFRIGSTFSDTDDINLNDTPNKPRVNKEVRKQSVHSETQQEREEETNRGRVDEYVDSIDNFEMHTFKNLHSNKDFRREKYKWNEKTENPSSVEHERKKKYADEPYDNDNIWETKTVNWDRIATTKDYTVKYKNKKTYKESEYQKKPSYIRPKKEYSNKEPHLYGRTSIPFAGRKGVYDEK